MGENHEVNSPKIFLDDDGGVLVRQIFLVDDGGVLVRQTTQASLQIKVAM